MKIYESFVEGFEQNLHIEFGVDDGNILHHKWDEC